MAKVVGSLELKEPKMLPNQPLWWKFILGLAIFGPFGATLFAIVVCLLFRTFDIVDGVGLFIGVSLTVFGVGAGLHRGLTHRGFIMHPIVEFFILVFASMAGEGSVLAWSGDHAFHHANSDTEDDLHSPHNHKGGFWSILIAFGKAHIWWIFLGRHANPRFWVKHLYRDSMAVAMSDTFIIWFLLGLLIPFLIGGWEGLLWLGFVRIFITHQLTFAVNSACHMWGKRPFDTDDFSTNNPILSQPTFGEAYHCNHHARPRSACHGFLPGQIDITWQGIYLLFKLNLVDDLYKAVCEIDPKTRKAKLDGKGQPVCKLVKFELQKTPKWVIESRKRMEKEEVA